MPQHHFSEAFGKRHLVCPSPRHPPQKARPPPGYMTGCCPQRCCALSADLHRCLGRTVLSLSSLSLLKTENNVMLFPRQKAIIRYSRY